MGTTPKTIYALRDGVHAPSIFSLYLFARATGRSMEWFLTGEETPVGPVFEEWTRTRGAIDDEARAFLLSLNLRGRRPSLVFYDYALIAFRNGLTAADATSAASATEMLR